MFSNSVYICEMTISNLRRHRTIKKNSRASKIQCPSTEKTAQALWRCCNGLVMDFKEEGQQYYIAKQYQSALQSSWMFSGCNKLGVPFSSPGCHVCRMICLSGVISHPATPEDETSGNLQQLVWSHGETAVLVVSCKAVGFLSVAACCTWRNNQEPQTSPSLQIANGWKEQRHKKRYKKVAEL